MGVTEITFPDGWLRRDAARAAKRVAGWRLLEAQADVRKAEAFLDSARQRATQAMLEYVKIEVPK